jgi:glycosyltransferase involved in cell wall biosynthesis
MKIDYVIVFPCFNENNIIIEFLKKLEIQLKDLSQNFMVVIVDDGSIDNTLELLRSFRFNSTNIFKKVIHLKYNVGHQKAIYQGLHYAHQFNAKGYIVMDSDGEDDPAAIPEIISIQGSDIVFVTRGKRKDSFLFKCGYTLYKIIFRLVVNKKINFGNFTMINRSTLDAVLNNNYIHYSAFLSKLRVRKNEIKFSRMIRIGGKPKMNYNSLVIHGLKALIEYSEAVLLFFIRLFILLLLFIGGFGAVVLYKKFVSHEAILGWTSTLGSSLINSALIILGIIVLGLLLLNLNEKSMPKQAIYEEMEDDEDL